MKLKLPAAIFCLGLLLQASAIATSDEQQATIVELGELNGVALQCRYFEQMQRIKRSLVANLPKRRELGLLFEDATNRSFIAFMQRDATCPKPQDFVEQVDAAVGVLETAFPR